MSRLSGQFVGLGSNPSPPDEPDDLSDAEIAEYDRLTEQDRAVARREKIRKQLMNTEPKINVDSPIGGDCPECGGQYDHREGCSMITSNHRATPETDAEPKHAVAGPAGMFATVHVDHARALERRIKFAQEVEIPAWMERAESYKRACDKNANERDDARGDLASCADRINTALRELGKPYQIEDHLTLGKMRDGIDALSDAAVGSRAELQRVTAERDARWPEEVMEHYRLLEMELGRMRVYVGHEPEAKKLRDDHRALRTAADAMAEASEMYASIVRMNLLLATPEDYAENLKNPEAELVKAIAAYRTTLPAQQPTTEGGE